MENKPYRETYKFIAILIFPTHLFKSKTARFSNQGPRVDFLHLRVQLFLKSKLQFKAVKTFDFDYSINFGSTVLYKNVLAEFIAVSALVRGRETYSLE